MSTATHKLTGSEQLGRQRRSAWARRALRPALKVLFITGYAETVALGDRQAGPATQVLTKPFTVDALGARVSGMLSRA